jgi:aspartyl-tRNA(Asn)/glutamyl-tRNA(Gln) amidotransferase subunit B
MRESIIARESSVREFKTAVGLEIHAQLKTVSKMFCGCCTEFGAPPNSRVCPVCLGLPGALPVLNYRAVELALRVGSAARCLIAPVSVFARKNYFYPDLPKGYQISQYEHPLCRGGEIEFSLNGDSGIVKLVRMHLEEDAGKSLHPRDSGGDFTLVDFNRCGVPLLEIVTEPHLGSPREASACLEAVKQLLEYLQVCDGDMEKGSLRCDVNVSVSRGTVRPAAAEGDHVSAEAGKPDPAGKARGTSDSVVVPPGAVGARTEIKNLNSFRNLEKALSFEIERQKKILSRGHKIKRQTLLWDEARKECVPMRSKEEAHDYRYFPEPDLPPLVVTRDLLAEAERGLPELPWKRRKRFREEYRLPAYDAGLLTSTRAMADYYEDCVKAGADPKTASNWIMTELLRVVGRRGGEIEKVPVSATGLAELLVLVGDGTVSGTAAKAVFGEMLESGEGASSIVNRRGLAQIKDVEEIEAVVAEILLKERKAVEEYRKGKERALKFLIGSVMKAMGERADPRLVREALERGLSRLKGQS